MQKKFGVSSKGFNKKQHTTEVWLNGGFSAKLNI